MLGTKQRDFSDPSTFIRSVLLVRESDPSECISNSMTRTKQTEIVGGIDPPCYMLGVCVSVKTQSNSTNICTLVATITFSVCSVFFSIYVLFVSDSLSSNKGTHNVHVNILILSTASLDLRTQNVKLKNCSMYRFKPHTIHPYLHKCALISVA
jgi:hypothetical protein